MKKVVRMKAKDKSTTRKRTKCLGSAWKVSLVAGLLVCALAGTGGQNEQAAQALIQANSLEELATAVSKYGSSGAGTGLKLCLAKTHYDAGQYQDALALYEAVVKDVGKDDPFLDIAELGRAHALEGLKKYVEASAAFSAYASDGAKTHDGFRLTAQLGVARCKALQGDVAGAESDLRALKEATTDQMKQMRIEEMLTLLKHYDFSRKDPNPTEALMLSEDVPLFDEPPASAPAARPAPTPAKPPW